jgi:hypothetical protein
MRICHVASGDLWAGAEVQVFTLVEYLSRQPGIAVSAVVLNERELAARLRGLGVDLTVLDETRLGALPTLRALAAAMRRLIEDRTLRERLGAGARARAQDFTADVVVPRYEALYQRAIRAAAVR